MFSSSNSGKEFSPSCVKLYLNGFDQDEKIFINKKAARKTVLSIPMNSLRSAISYIMNIVASNLIGDKIPQDHLANNKFGTYGSQTLVGVMQYSFGKDVDFYPIRRSLLSSTDDKTLFISTGKISKH